MKIHICECGCFKFYIGWSTAHCAHCGKEVGGRQFKDWMVKDTDVIDLKRSTKKPNI